MISPWCAKPKSLSVLFAATFLQFLTTTITSTTAEVTTTLTTINYSDGDHSLQGFLALPKTTLLPAPAVVLILPDWDGVNDYEKKRAVQIASELGYAAFAADIYGTELHNVMELSEKRRLATLYRNDESLFLSRIQAAIDLMKDRSRDEDYNGPIGMIGYCLGGTGVLMYALSGATDADALVSLHGGLLDFEVGPAVIPKLLVLSGGEDDTATTITNLELTLDSVDAIWEITRYSGIQHGFTVFENPAYDAWADARSWSSMSSFLTEAFGIEQYDSGEPAESRTNAIEYEDVDGTSLRGYLSVPDRNTLAHDTERLVRAVIIIPDWDGVNEYEKLRATMLSDAGYIAFAADIYGADLQEDLTFDQMVAQSTYYRSNSTLYHQRMQMAIQTLRSNVVEDDEFGLDGRIAIIGYCFGGTGVVQYAFSGATDVAVAVAFHGGLTDLPPAAPTIHARVVVLSGGIDDAHGNQTELEEELDRGGGGGAAAAGWEITRYAGVNHGFTNWGGLGYNLRADARSWDEMMSIFEDMKQSPDPTSTPSIFEDMKQSPDPTSTPTSKSPKKKSKKVKKA